ncbi:MAG: alpha/beta hydrolase [Crocinitomicaceae bacterium]|nr:alpha/beta hydrolase [Crocinitomicaceae bacterium]
MKVISLIFFSCLTVFALSYQQEEVSLKAKGCTLKGTLVTQDDVSQSTPLVILIAGSGPTDRNGNNPQMSNNSLKYLSDMFVENGYACLRYDKRAIGESEVTEFSHVNISFDSFIEDAIAWVNQYAADIRFHQIILAGHSQGSLVALCAANQNENVGAVISLAGAGEPIHEVLKWQLAQTLSPEIQGVVDAKLDTLAAGDTLQQVPDYMMSLFHPSIQPFLISWMKYDPAEQAKKLNVPLLIVNGNRDAQVSVEQAKMLKEANPDAELKIIRNMNHVLKFTKLKSGLEQLEVYGDPDLPLHKKLPKVILKWLETLK